MSDPRIVKLAHLLVNYCIQVRPGEQIMVEGSSASLPLVKETYRAVLQAGGQPTLVWNEQFVEEILLKEGNADQLSYIADPKKAMYETFDGRIFMWDSLNTRNLTSVTPENQKLRTAARQILRGITAKRAATGDLRWVGTMYPTHGLAQDADMSLEEFEDFVYGACHVDKEDPAAEWRKLSAMQQMLVDYLKGKKQVEVKGPNAELTLSIEGRTFINSDGRRNMPSGEIFTGPVEESVNGWVRYSYPAIHNGREVEGIELRFEEGKVIDASAKKNEAYLIHVLDTDPGARYLGEFAIGTNDGIQQFTRSILFDEKIGGTIHTAVGATYPETGGKNQSAVHWDMICDMRDGGQIFVDGELFYESGKFTIL